LLPYKLKLLSCWNNWFAIPKSGPGQKVPAKFRWWLSEETLTTYSAEFKDSAVKLALESSQSISQIARELGVNKSTLYTWVNNYRNKNNQESGNEETMLTELKRLKSENKRLLEEREILKKATVYFAKIAK
jgi:transposase